MRVGCLFVIYALQCFNRGLPLCKETGSAFGTAHADVTKKAPHCDMGPHNDSAQIACRNPDCARRTLY